MAVIELNWIQAIDGGMTSGRYDPKNHSAKTTHYSVDQLFLTSHFASEELSFHSSQHWSILHENQWKSTVFDYSINVSNSFCLLCSNENFSFQKLATHTS